jgi:hypothetical protein
MVYRANPLGAGMASSLKPYRASLLVWPTIGHLFYVLVMLLVGLLDVIDAFPESCSIVPNEIGSLQGLCAFRFGLRSGVCGGSFSLTSG